MTESSPRPPTAGVILAGGRASRFGGRDKGWVEWGGRPLIETVIARFAPQVDVLALSVNRNMARYARLGYPLLADSEAFGEAATQGPLAGLHAVLDECSRPWLACVSCDLPGLPADLVARLHAGRGTAPAAYAFDGRRGHYLCCLLERSLCGALEEYLAAGRRAVRHWWEEIGAIAVDFSDCPGGFVNVNSPEELEKLEKAR